METVKIVFDIDSKDVKTTTDELKALNKVTNEEVASLDKLSQTASDAGDGFVSLRTRVKEAKEEAIKAAEKYGEFSAQALEAKKKAGALADQMSDLNRQVNLLNPEAKAKAFSNLAQGVIGAFSVATGALQAFGVKNKEVEELAMKLQGALNITQGIASLGQLKESLQDVKVVLGFTTVATEALTVANEAEAVSSTEAAIATKGFTASLMANPVFLVIGAVGALAGAMIYLSQDTDEAKTSVIDFTEENKTLQKALDASKESADKAARAIIDLKVAKGEMSQADATIAKNNMDLAKSTEDVQKSIASNRVTIDSYRKSLIDAKKQYDNDVAEAEKTARLSGNTFADRQLAQDKKIAKDRYDQTVKDTKERIKKEQEILKANEANLGNITAETQSKNTAATIEGNKQRKASNDQAAKEAEARAKEQIRLADELRKQLQENALAEEADPIKRIQMAKKFADINYDIESARLNNDKASQNERDLLAAEHTATIKKLDNDELIANKDKNNKVLEAEKKLQDALLALQLAQENDPVKRAQIINDAKEKEIDNQLKLVEKGSADEQSLLAQKATAEIEAQKRIGAALVEVNKNTNKDINKEEEKAAAERKAIRDGAFQLASFAVQAYGEAVNRQTDEELATLEEQKNKKLINEKQYQQRLKQIKQKQAEDAKKQAIYQATLDFSAALINALTFKPSNEVPAALVFASILAAANLAKIIATPVPKFQKGTLAVPGVDMGRDSVHAMLQPGEAVIPTKTNRAYHPTIKAIYEKKISPSEINNFVMSRTKAGGSSSIKASVDTYALTRALSKNKTVEVGNANMIGRAMAKELLRGQNYRRA
jgi:hypothetical protein